MSGSKSMTGKALPGDAMLDARMPKAGDCLGKPSDGSARRTEKKGPEDRPFLLYFLLPVGLADFMVQTLRGFSFLVNRENNLSLRSENHKKTAPFQRARPV
jgi:hypothetical protein